MVAIPVYLKHNIFYREGGAGRFDVSIGAKSTMGKTVRTIFVLFINKHNYWYVITYSKHFINY